MLSLRARSNTLKMKFPFVLFLLLDFPHIKGQERIEKFGHILLRLTFPSFYNNYNKSCCKLYPEGCYQLMDRAGYTRDLLNGRVTITENDGWIEFKISNVQFVDGGYYRCFVVGAPAHVYSDYYIEVHEYSGRHSQSLPSPTTTIKAPKSSTKLLDSSEDNSDSPRLSWASGLLLAVIASSAVMILIAVVIVVVCCRVKAKRKQSVKYGETLGESLKQEGRELSGVVYTAVDFRAHQKPTEGDASLRMHKTRGEAPDEMVEYSTLAIHL